MHHGGENTDASFRPARRLRRFWRRADRRARVSRYVASRNTRTSTSGSVSTYVPSTTSTRAAAKSTRRVRNTFPR